MNEADGIERAGFHDTGQHTLVASTHARWRIDPPLCTHSPSTSGHSGHRQKRVRSRFGSGGVFTDGETAGLKAPGRQSCSCPCSQHIRARRPSWTEQGAHARRKRHLVDFYGRTGAALPSINQPQAAVWCTDGLLCSPFIFALNVETEYSYVTRGRKNL